MKSRIYKINPQSILNLKDGIIRLSGETEQTFFQNYTKTVDICNRWSFFRCWFSV